MAAPPPERKVARREGGDGYVILDSGICTVFARENAAGKGEKPRYAYTRKTQSYYGELDFETGGVWTTQGREDRVVDTRIRILQDRTVKAHDVVVLADVTTTEDAEIYEIERAYHGRDDENGELISDLSLRKVNGK